MPLDTFRQEWQQGVCLINALPVAHVNLVVHLTCRAGSFVLATPGPAHPAQVPVWPFVALSFAFGIFALAPYFAGASLA